MVLPGKRPGMGTGGTAGLDEAAVQALIDADLASFAVPPALRTKREMQHIKAVGSTTVANVGINSPSGSFTSADDDDGPWGALATSTTINVAAGLVPSASAYTVVRPGWNPEAIFRVKTDSVAYADTRLGIGLVSGSGFDTDSTPALSLALFRYATDVDGTALWRCITDNGSGTPETTTTAVAVAADTDYVLDIRVTTAAVTFYIDGTLVATHTTTIPPAGTPLGHVIRIVNLATTARTIKWSRIAILHD